MIIIIFFFNTPGFKVFRAKFREILMRGSQEIGVYPRKLFRIQFFFFLLTMHALHFD